MIRNRSWNRGLRVATLLVPTLVAWSVAFSAASSGALVKAASEALIPVWVVMAAALLVRVIEGGVRHRRILDHLGLASAVPPIAPARAPPENEVFELDWGC